MTAADLGDDAPPGRRDSGPVAVISRGTLHANARLLHGHIVGDLPADAWGHGADEVRAALADAARGESAAVVADPAPAGVGAGQAVSTLLGLPGGDPLARPAMRLMGRVLSTKILRSGEGVSYGLTFRAPADTRIALVTGGYAQGVVRATGNRIAVSIADRRHAVIGRVAMDVCVVDIGDSVVDRGAPVVFFGDPQNREPRIDEWSAATGLSALELVTAVGLHARREHVS